MNKSCGKKYKTQIWDRSTRNRTIFVKKKTKYYLSENVFSDNNFLDFLKNNPEDYFLDSFFWDAVRNSLIGELFVFWIDCLVLSLKCYLKILVSDSLR